MGTLIATRSEGRARILTREHRSYGAKGSHDNRGKVGVVLWIVQALLAFLFLFAGTMKLVVAPEVLATMTPLPILFMKFIGLVEVLGGLGLILPGLTRIQTGLTPLAAAGLALEMVGATVTTLVMGGGTTAAMPLVVGLLAALVAYGRQAAARPTTGSERPALARIDPILRLSR